MGLDRFGDQAAGSLGVAVAFEDYSDNDLINAAKDGDEAAFAEIVRRYRDKLTNYLYRILRDYEEAVDLAQESFVRVYFAMDRYHSRYAFSTYVYRIATNLAISELRKRKRRKLYSLTGLFRNQDESADEYQPPDNRPLPEDDLLGGELREAIAKAIAALPEKYRLPIVLREIEELSYAEVAEILGLGIGTTKSRISRGRALLKRKLLKYLD